MLSDICHFCSFEVAKDDNPTAERQHTYGLVRYHLPAVYSNYEARMRRRQVISSLWSWREQSEGGKVKNTSRFLKRAHLKALA